MIFFLVVKSHPLGALQAEQFPREDILGESFNFGVEKPSSVLELVQQILVLTGRQDLEPEILNQATTAVSFAGNATPLTLGAIAYLVLFVPVVVLGRWIETRFAWKRA